MDLPAYIAVNPVSHTFQRLSLSLEDNTNIGCCTEFFLNNYREKFQFDDPYFWGEINALRFF